MRAKLQTRSAEGLAAINTDVEKGQRRLLGYSSAMTRPGRQDCDAVMKCASQPYCHQVVCQTNLLLLYSSHLSWKETYQ